MSRSRAAMSFSCAHAQLLRPQRVAVVPVIQQHRLVVHIQDVRHHVVQESVVVGDDHHRPLEVAQEHLEPADRDDVEVVGRLVEKKYVGGAGQYLSEQDPKLEPARQRGHGRAMHVRRKAQTLQNRGGTGFGGISVVPLKSLLQLGKPVGVEVLLRPRQQRLLLRHRVPQLRLPMRVTLRISSFSYTNWSWRRTPIRDASARRPCRHWTPGRAQDVEKRGLLPDPLAPTSP